MRAATGWKDFELLDAADGEKLERWGDVILARPDPQVIWKTPKGPEWGRANARYHRSSSAEWEIGYGPLRFCIRPTGFKHTGLFPEQAVNWDLMDGLVKNAGRELSVLNLFAYTGGATLACAAAGAKVCHVDASKGMVQWARDNAARSGLSDRPVRWIVDDCKKFVEREIRRGVRYDGIVMDPPSYGRGPGGEVWKLEDSVFDGDGVHPVGDGGGAVRRAGVRRRDRPAGHADGAGAPLREHRRLDARTVTAVRTRG